MKRLFFMVLLTVHGIAVAESEQEQASRILIAGYDAYGAECGFDKSAVPDDRAAAIAYAERARPCVIDKIRAYFQNQQPQQSPSWLESLGSGFQGMGEVARGRGAAPLPTVRQIDYPCMQRCIQAGSYSPYCTSLCSY